MTLISDSVPCLSTIIVIIIFWFLYHKMDILYHKTNNLHNIINTRGLIVYSTDLISFISHRDGAPERHQQSGQWVAFKVGNIFANPKLYIGTILIWSHPISFFKQRDEITDMGISHIL